MAQGRVAVRGNRFTKAGGTQCNGSRLFAPCIASPALINT